MDGVKLLLQQEVDINQPDAMVSNYMKTVDLLSVEDVESFIYRTVVSMNYF